MINWNLARWSEDKNRRLKAERGLSFEAVLAAVEAGQMLDNLSHPDPQRSHQCMLVVAIEGYACCVPYVGQGDEVFMKTIYRSRLFQVKYMRNK